MENIGKLSKDSAQVEFALARSEFMDRFADMEAAICKLLALDGKLPGSKEPFGHRLKAFREIETNSVIAKCRLAQRNQIADGIAKLLPIRADLVHSRMHVTTLDGRDVGLFVNSQIAHDPDAPARFLTIERITQLSQKLSQYSEKLATLRQPINQPSSQLPPSPDAAGGP